MRIKIIDETGQEIVADTEHLTDCLEENLAKIREALAGTDPELEIARRALEAAELTRPEPMLLQVCAWCGCVIRSVPALGTDTSVPSSGICRPCLATHFPDC